MQEDHAPRAAGSLDVDLELDTDLPASYAKTQLGRAAPAATFLDPCLTVVRGCTLTRHRSWGTGEVDEDEDACNEADPHNHPTCHETDGAPRVAVRQ